MPSYIFRQLADGSVRGARVTGVNDAGIACGYMLVPGPAFMKACTWDLPSGTMNLLDTDAAVGSAAHACAEDGTVGGFHGGSHPASLAVSPCIWSATGTRTTLPAGDDTTSGSVMALATGMRAGGHANRSLPQPAYWPSAATVQRFPQTFDLFEGTAYSVNEGGVAVGWGYSGDERRTPGFIIQGGSLDLLAGPGGITASVIQAWDINAAGTIVALVADPVGSGGSGLSGLYTRDAAGTWTALGRTAGRAWIDDAGRVLTSDGWLLSPSGWEYVPPTVAGNHLSGTFAFTGFTNDGRISGNTQVGDVSHPFVLEPVAVSAPGIRPGLERMVAHILFGVTNDGGGVIIVNGKPEPVPPWNPLVRDAFIALATSELAMLSSDAAQRTALGVAGADALAAAAKRLRRNAQAGGTSEVSAADAVLPPATAKGKVARE